MKILTCIGIILLMINLVAASQEKVVVRIFVAPKANIYSVNEKENNQNRFYVNLSEGNQKIKDTNKSLGSSPGISFSVENPNVEKDKNIESNISKNILISKITVIINKLKKIRF